LDQITAEDRARWLAELAEAIAEAQELAWRMSGEQGICSDGLDLLARIDFARAEVEALRCNGWARPVRRDPLDRSDLPIAG
jgi:hypothetical protein